MITSKEYLKQLDTIDPNWTEDDDKICKALDDFLLKNIQKSDKKILFTTEDMVNIYDREQEVFAIKKGEYELMNQYNGCSIAVWLNGWYTTEWLSNPEEHDNRIVPLIDEHYLIFSTKEAAEDYIINNKPCLSLKEVMSVPEVLKKYCLQQCLREIIESKIKIKNK